MSNQLILDSQQRPDLFSWYGAIPRKDLTEWCQVRGLFVPDDLMALLSETGGGDIFESETILGPLCGVETGDDCDSANAFHRGRGLPDGLWLFHVGFVLSAIRTNDGGYVVLTNEYRPIGFYRNLGEWYTEVVRPEFEERYRLRPAARP